MWYFVCFLFLFFSLCAYISILNMLFFSVVAFVFRLLGSLYQQVISDRIRGVLFPSLRTSTVELCSIVCVCMYQARLEQLSTQRFCQSFILFARWHQLFAKENVLLFFSKALLKSFHAHTSIHANGVIPSCLEWIYFRGDENVGGFHIALATFCFVLFYKTLLPIST